MNGPNPLESSPSGFSTLITSALRSDSICVAKGPERTFVKSKTDIFPRGKISCSLKLSSFINLITGVISMINFELFNEKK